MSLIHQALKKAEGARPEAQTGIAFKRPGLRSFRQLVIPSVFVVSLVFAYVFFSPSGKTEKPNAPAAVKTASPAQAVRTAPVDLNAEGMTEFKAGRFKEAEAVFLKAIAASPSARLHSNLGLALFKLGKTGEAEAAFKKALDMEPLNKEALNNYACLLVETGRSKKALPLLERAVKADPAYADARLNMAVLLEKKGDIQGAFSHYEAFMGLGPSENDASIVRKKLMMLRSELILKQAGGR